MFLNQCIFSRVRLRYDEWRPGGAIVSTQYLKNEMPDLNETWYTHAMW